MNVFKKATVMLALAVGSLFIGLGSADAQWGYRRGYYGGYAPRYYSGYAPYYGYRSYYARPYYGGYGYRPYYARPYYGGYGYRPYGYYGGSGVYVGQGGIAIRY